RQSGRAVTRDALAIAERIQKRTAEHDAEVFGRVVPVDLDVSGALDGQVEQAVARQLLHHVRQERDWRLHASLPRPVEVDLDRNPSFVGVADTLTDAHDRYSR